MHDLTTTYRVKMPNMAVPDCIQACEEMSKQRIEKLDYEGQIDRWNAYNMVADRMSVIVGGHHGASFRKNITTNLDKKRSWADALDNQPNSYDERGTILNILLGLSASFGGALIGLFWSWLPAVGLVIGCAGLAAVKNLRHHMPARPAPKILHMRMAPEIHIDEVESAKSIVAGFESPKPVDPIIRLPVIELHVPLSYFGQKKLHEVMNDKRLVGLP